MKTFVFDVDDTLYDQNQPFLKAWHELGYDRYAIDAAMMWKRARAYGDEVFAKVNSGEMSVDESGVYRLTKALADEDILISIQDALKLQQTYRYNLGHIELTPLMHELLNDLKGMVNLAILTNGPYEHQMGKVKALALDQYIDEDHVFVSGNYAFSKPDKRIFEVVERSLGVKNEDCWYIGDSYQNDIQGAFNAFWHVIWLNRRHYDNSVSGIDYVCSSEPELATLLRKLANDE